MECLKNINSCSTSNVNIDDTMTISHYMKMVIIVYISALSYFKEKRNTNICYYFYYYMKFRTTHDPLTFNSTKETFRQSFTSEFQENLEELFPRYYT